MWTMMNVIAASIGFIQHKVNNFDREYNKVTYQRFQKGIEVEEEDIQK